MKPSLMIISGVLIGISSMTYGLEPEQPDPDMKVPLKGIINAWAFDLRDVRLLEGPFKHAMQKDGEYLLYLEPDRLLAWFRKDAGLEPKAEVYGGWETQGIAGHSLGHYLSACALMYAASGDERFRDKVNYIVDDLELIQATNGNGYIAAIPEGRRVFEEILQGNIRTRNFDLNGVWVPWYTLHKQLAGLQDVYYYCDNKLALDVAIKLADWICRFCDQLTDDQMQQMMRCEHGGINEALANMYALTGEEKYLKCAEKFYHKAVMDPLAREKDCLPGLHANTQIPKLIGLARLYELTDRKTYHDAAAFFWQTVVYHHSYVIGGHSNNEYFGPPDTLNDRLSERTTETCNTYNMLKLTRHLSTWNSKAAYGDFYERAVYNHILASQNPEDGMMCYCVPLKTGSVKQFSDRDNSFWCCVGTGIENHALYGAGIYYHSTTGLYVDLFIPSELTWKEKGLVLRQETRFPESPVMTYTFACEQPVDLALFIRKPWWSEKEISVTVNGEEQTVAVNTDGYLSLSRTWKSNDTVVVTIPLTLRTEAMPDNDKRIAVMYGPIVLAADLGAPRDAYTTPVLVTEDKKVSDWLKLVPGKALTFVTEGVARPEQLILKPFYGIYDRRFAVYFDLFTPAEWALKQKEYEEEQRKIKEMEARTIDDMRLGEMQPERDHNFKDENSRVGDDDNTKWRGAYNGGWFSFNMKVLPDAPVDLVVKYRGGRRWRGTEFDILVNGEKLTTEKLQEEKPDDFYYTTYAVPETMTKGKETVTVKFETHERAGTGRIYECRTVRRGE